MRKVSREEAGLIELGRRLPDSALATFQSCRDRLLKSLELEARYGGLTSDGRVERQMTLEQLNGLSVEALGISFFDLCGRIVDWATASFRGGTPGTTVHPDRMLTFPLGGVDERIAVRPGGVNAYLEEIVPPVQPVVKPVTPPVPPPPLVTFPTLEVRILPRQEKGYPVNLIWDDPDNANVQVSERGHLAANITPWTSTGKWIEDGRNLFAALTAEPAVLAAWARAEGKASQRRIRLNVDETAAELHALPWELLYDRGFLAANSNTPFSRLMPAFEDWPDVLDQPPLRVLAAVANPRDLAEYKLAPLPDDEAIILKELSLPQIHFEVLPAPVTLAHIGEALREGQYHALHIMAHGMFSQRNERGTLLLEDARGNACPVTAEEIGRMFAHLKQQQRPRLVFLAVCESAAHTATSAFASIGPHLGRAGVPMVIAMQDRVALTTARRLAQVFYGRLAAYGVVDLALNEARAMLDLEKSADLDVPVLYMRPGAGRLWKG